MKLSVRFQTVKGCSGGSVDAGRRLIQRFRNSGDDYSKRTRSDRYEHYRNVICIIHSVRSKSLAPTALPRSGGAEVSRSPLHSGCGGSTSQAAEACPAFCPGGADPQRFLEGDIESAAEESMPTCATVRSTITRRNRGFATRFRARSAGPPQVGSHDEQFHDRRLMIHAK
jgi:hypothetical protein